jgi:flagellar L-ring protein precursor FlgH
VENTSDGGGVTRRQGNLTARITANVIEVDASGLLVVEGTRKVKVNGEEEKIVLRGKLRPEDVRPDNTVLSTFVADASIEFTGHGSLDNAARPGIVTRILNWIF